MNHSSISRRLNHDPALTAGIQAAVKRLYKKLMTLDLKQLDISEYNEIYLKDKINHGTAFLKLYADLLDCAMNPVDSEQPVHPDDFVLVDYGGGNGLLSLLAREAGIGTVIYNDIYDVSCRDIEKLSEALNLPMNHIHCGDVDSLITYTNSRDIWINALVSFDVLEHIYDVEYHFNALTNLERKPFRIVYATGANIRNPFYVRSVRKKQLEAEFRNREKKTGHKERDTTKAYLQIRKEIITGYAPLLKPDEVDYLAHSTRGLIKEDIERCVKEFLEKGEITYQPDHPTNTCDPYTGNWCEHLIDHNWLEATLTEAGYEVEIFPGYNEFGSPVKKFLKLFVNKLIFLFGRKVMFLAPHYIVYANRKQIS